MYRLNCINNVETNICWNGLFMSLSSTNKTKTNVGITFLQQQQNLPSGRSCLFANINIIASLISLSFIILCNSVRASSILSRSAQSTTNIKPCVPAKKKAKQKKKLNLMGFFNFFFCSYLCNNASITVEFYLVRLHPKH